MSQYNPLHNVYIIFRKMLSLNIIRIAFMITATLNIIIIIIKLFLLHLLQKE